MHLSGDCNTVWQIHGASAILKLVISNILITPGISRRFPGIAKTVTMVTARHLPVQERCACRTNPHPSEIIPLQTRHKSPGPEKVNKESVVLIQCH